MEIIGTAKSFAERYRELSRNDPAFRGASFVLVGLAALFVMGPAIGHIVTAITYFYPIQQGCTEQYSYVYNQYTGYVRIDLGYCVPNIVWLEQITIITTAITGLLGFIIGF